MNGLTKTTLVLIAAQSMAGCAELALLSGAALTGVGLADGDIGTAALGAMVMDAGIQGSEGDDYDVGSSVSAGLWAGAAAETGNAGLLVNAVSSTGSAANGATTSTGIGQIDKNRSIEGSTTSTNCAALEKQLQREIAELQRQQNQSQGICATARTARKVGRIAVEFNSKCPINDPTGEMVAWGREMIQWGNQVEQQTCVGY